MMIDLCNKLVNNDLTKEELLPNIEVVSTSFADAPMLTWLLSKCFDLKGGQEEAIRQLVYSDAQLDNSVKAIDKRTGEIYGFLILSKFPIKVGSPIQFVNNRLDSFLSQFSQINGHSFIIDERLRGCGIDKEMLKLQYEYINQFDFIWAAVENDLKTHSYWKRLGFKELFKIPEATFYGIFNKNRFVDDIYDIVDTLKDENNNYK